MSSPESKELMKLFKCSTDIATQVVCAFVDTKLLSQYGSSFLKYLENELHFFYHQWDTKKTACCACPSAGCTIRRLKKMENWIFNTFYDDTGHVHRNHVLQTGQTTQQRCLHKYVARNIRLDNLDITILCFILLCAGKLTVTEKIAIETINNKRNLICHAWSTKCFSMTQLNDIWTDIEIALSSLTNPFMRPIIQSQIQFIKQCDVEKEEIVLLSSKIDEINALLEKVNSRIPNNSDTLTNIEDKLTQISQQNTEDIKHHTSHHVSQIQEVLSKEIKELEVSFLHAIGNLSMSVVYDKQVNVLVPQEQFKGPIDCPVLWQMATPQGWDIEEVEAKLKDPAFQGEMVKIKFVKRGSLIIMTTISTWILNDQKTFETAIKTFLDKLIEVCQIDTKVHAQVDIRLHILDPNEVKLTSEVPKTRVQMKNKFSQTDKTALDIEGIIKNMTLYCINPDGNIVPAIGVVSRANLINMPKGNTGAYKRPHSDSRIAYADIESRMSDQMTEKGITRSNQHLLETAKRPESDLRSMTMIMLKNLLQSVKLNRFADICFEKQIDGVVFMDMTDEKLKEEPFSLTQFQLLKVTKLQGGWKPT